MPENGARSRLHEAGDHAVDVPVVCVLTRFGLRSPGHLLPTYRDFQRVVAELREVETPGLLRSAFLVENSRTCYSLSLWAQRQDIPRFGANVPGHVEAARRVIGRLEVDPARGPELWSTKWRLESVSNNLNWSDFDLRGVVQSLGHAAGRE